MNQYDDHWYLFSEDDHTTICVPDTGPDVEDAVTTLW